MLKKVLITTMLIAVNTTNVSARGIKDAYSHYPDYVAAKMRKLKLECELEGEKFEDKGLVQKIDLNNDGKMDYVIDIGAGTCHYIRYAVAGNSDYYPVYFYVSHNHYEQSLELHPSRARVTRARVIKHNGKARLYAGVDGEYCGQDTRNLSRVDYEGCIRPVIWNAKKKKIELGSLKEKRKTPDNWWE